MFHSRINSKNQNKDNDIHGYIQQYFKFYLFSGNAELVNLSPTKLKRRFICEDHFKKTDFMTRKLIASAVPLKYSLPSHSNKEYRPSARQEYEAVPSTSADLQTEIYYVTPPKASKSTSDSDESTCNPTEMTTLPSPKRKVTSKSAISLKRKLVYTERRLRATERKLKRKSILTVPRNINTLPTMSGALTRMQLYHKSRAPWLPDEKVTALSLFYKSPATYRYMRSKGVVLPSPSSISTWLKTFECRPGLNKKLLNLLRIKVDTMSSKTKQCILCFDEMSLKQCLEFSKPKDVIEGTEDLGEFGRKPHFAKQALVFLLRGLYSNWKLPLCFFFTSTGVKAEDLLKIVEKVLVSLNDIALNPMAIVCDQSSSNQKLFKLLNISVEKPYFNVNEQKYFAIFDAPHLIKSIRNNLLDGDFLLDENIITFTDIRAVYALDKSSTTGKALPKLTDIHMMPNAFQKMNVKLAVQVLSHSVSAAILTAKETGQLTSKTATNTASFIKDVNDGFDVLNSRKLSSTNMCNAALSSNNIHGIVILDKLSSIMKKIQKIDAKGNPRRPPCFDGLLLTIAAIKEIYEHQKSKGYPFLLTSRLNQDILENQFSIYRQRGGYARNPTVRLFQAAFKANYVHNLLKPPSTSNYEDCDYSNALLTIEDNIDIDSTSSESDNVSINSSSASSLECAVTLEDCSITYFAGYLVKRCWDKYSCEQCNSVLSDNTELSDDSEILLFYKNYNIDNPVSLKKSSKLHSRVIKEAMKTFARYFNKFWTKRKLSKIILQKINNKIKKIGPEWYGGGICTEHRNYILNLLVRILIYKECKSISSGMKSSGGSEKLQILKNL